VRMGNWKGIRLDLKKNPQSPIALYNLAEDPKEETDLATKHPEVVAKIKGFMAEAHVESKLFPFFKL